MAVNRRIEVTNFSGSAGEVSMVRFLDRKIIDAANIQELGDELFALVEKEQRKNLLLNFASVSRKLNRVTAAIIRPIPWRFRLRARAALSIACVCVTRMIHRVAE